jgi:hypothetical protein
VGHLHLRLSLLMEGKCMEMRVQGSGVYAELSDDSKLQEIEGRKLARKTPGLIGKRCLYGICAYPLLDASSARARIASCFMVMVFGEKTITARSPSAARLCVRRGRDGDDSQAGVPAVVPGAAVGRCASGGLTPNFWMGADRRLVRGMCTRLQPLLERLEELKVHVGR